MWRNDSKMGRNCDSNKEKPKYIYDKIKTAKRVPSLICKTTGLVIQTRDIHTHPGGPHSGFGKSALL